MKPVAKTLTLALLLGSLTGSASANPGGPMGPKAFVDAHLGGVAAKLGGKFSTNVGFYQHGTSESANDLANKMDRSGRFQVRQRLLLKRDATGKTTDEKGHSLGHVLVTRYRSGRETLTLAADSYGGRAVRVRESERRGDTSMKSISIDASGTKFVATDKSHNPAETLLDGEHLPSITFRRVMTETAGADHNVARLVQTETIGTKPHHVDQRLTAKAGQLQIVESP